MKKSLARPLAETAAPVFALDSRRTIVFGNAALAAWLEVELADLLGQRAEYAASSLVSPCDVAVSALAPPPEVLQGAQALGLVSVPSANGAVRCRRVRYAMIPQRGETWIVGVLDAHDLPEDEAAEREAALGEQQTAAELHRDLLVLRAQWQRRYRCDRLIGDSAVAQRLREQVRIAIDGRARTTIIGPPGSGREHIARTIHGGSGSETIALLPLACSLLDPDLLEAAVEAFLRQSPNSTNDSTILLLEADQLSPECQQAILRMLQSARQPVRTLCTARQSLSQLAAKGLYHAELGSWLSTLEIYLPPLSERKQDLPLLAQQALEDHNASREMPLTGFQPEALDALVAYSWPANGDELMAAVQTATRNASGTLIALADLPEAVRRAAEPKRAERVEEPIELDQFLADVERELIARALRKSKGNKALAARWLGIPRVRLLRRMEQLGLS